MVNHLRVSGKRNMPRTVLDTMDQSLVAAGGLPLPDRSWRFLDELRAAVGGHGYGGLLVCITRSRHRRC